MVFLIKAAFWLTVVLVLLPSGGGSTRNSAVSPSEALSAAQATVDDMRQFCERQPTACSVGGGVLSSVGERAQSGARFLVDLLSGQPSEAKRPSGLLRGSLDPAQEPGRFTLSPADVAPPWRGPEGRSPQPARRPA